MGTLHPKLSGKQICLLIAASVVFACSNTPQYEVVGQQGIARFIVVSEQVANQDDALWEIADTLRRDAPGQTIQAMFWTDKNAAARRIPLSDQQLETLTVTININPSTGHRQLTRSRR